MHVCWLCGKDRITHQHWPKRSQGGKGIVAILCQEHHMMIDNEARLWNYVVSGVYVLHDVERVLVRRDVKTGESLMGN